MVGSSLSMTDSAESSTNGKKPEPSNPTRQTNQQNEGHVCPHCFKKYQSRKALGGHQNAHRHERHLLKLFQKTATQRPDAVEDAEPLRMVLPNRIGYFHRFAMNRSVQPRPSSGQSVPVGHRAPSSGQPRFQSTAPFGSVGYRSPLEPLEPSPGHGSQPLVQSGDGAGVTGSSGFPKPNVESNGADHADSLDLALKL
ncbi:hypothetical protein Nepgr_030218 [Nepenthes gracilis]|uniref:C2H2-type domain-containing protein n=1 Tax=Nepenthes gracilis TaxID=150966 RepID=A0AAD3TEY4_NEPGR|nr:hypothetical protein Nepgr_030218 [Nepenthes gracilis]